VILRHSALAALLVILLTWWGAVAAQAQPRPEFPPLSGRIVDQARLLNPASYEQIEAKLAALERDTGHQMVVVTVDDLQGLEIEDYGYRLGRTWGIGRATQNDGVLLIVAPKERKVRLEVGYGLEPVLTDAFSAQVIQNHILPHFRTRHFRAGITAGVDAVDRQLRIDPAQAESRALAAEPPRNGAPVGPIVVIGLVFLFIFIAAWGAAASSGGRRRRRRGVAPILIWSAAEALSRSSRGSRSSSSWSGGGFGGFSGGGGSFGGGGASGGW
jgi:uncharacterized protein